jgi:hypothetical protein
MGAKLGHRVTEIAKENMRKAALNQIKKGIRKGIYSKNHKVHESKESLVKEAFEHEQKMHTIPKTNLKVKLK